MKNNGNIIAYTFAITCVVLWGFSFVWANFLIGSGVGILAYMAERMLVAASLLWIVGLLTKKIQKVDKTDRKWMFLLGFSEPFVYFIGENYGIKYTHSGVIAALMIALVPVFCMFAERIFYKVPLSPKRMLGVLITLPGILMVIFQKDGMAGAQFAGILLLLLAVTASCSYNMFTKKMTEKYSPYTIVTWQFTYGAMLFVPLFLICDVKGVTPVFFTLPVQLTILALAVLCSGVCFGMWAYMTGKMGVTRTSIFSALIPLATAIVAYLLYPEQESFSWLKVAGIVVAVFGVILVQLAPSKSS